MPLELAQIVSGWPFAASLAAGVTARTLQAARQRTVLNEALHELRRPLQALALMSPGGALEPQRVDQSLRLASTALERLDREINGTPSALDRQTLAAEPLLREAVERWRPRAEIAGARLELRWRAAGAVLCGERCELAQALDNLIVNAIEHGGPRVVVSATLGVGWLRIAVVDSGRGPASAPPLGPRLPELIGRWSGRRRHGHGLRVVRRTAVAHGGSFTLHCREGGAEARLEVPLLGGEAGG